MPAAPSVARRLADFQATVDDLRQWRVAPVFGGSWRHKLNELRLVRLTLAWETFLEETFICYLRGGRSVSGQTYPLSQGVVRPANMKQATILATSGQSYGKWLDENWARGRATILFVAGGPYAGVLATARLTEVRVTRNRIVHRSDKTRKDFQTLVTNKFGSWPHGYTPGRYLTDDEAGKTRFDRLADFLEASATIVAS